ncbi:MAG: hypothetical protein ACXADB_02360 [Candidatus Hermodarchaeia archaeon]|jgi:hypothetical protein
MTDLDPRIDNCKPRKIHLDKERRVEMKSSIDEMLEPSARHRVMSYQQAIQIIKQFTYVIRDCNYLIEPEN